jgi:hypothetical protein
MIRVHMNDQIRNRVEHIMSETKSVNWDEVLQNITMLGIMGIFIVAKLNS